MTPHPALWLTFTVLGLALACFIVSLVAIHKTLRGWRDERNLAVLANLVGLWIGTIGMELADPSLGFIVQFLLVETAYLMLRRTRETA